MSNNYKEIIIDTWIRRTTFKWFEAFANPTYSFNVKVDVTDIVRYSKESNTSFFINFLYVISRVNNEIESLRLRYIDKHVYLYERIDPTFTVKTKDGSFNNAYVRYTSDYQKFYELVSEEVKNRCEYTDNSEVYNKPQYDVFYSSCLTSIDLQGMTQPLNYDDKNSINVPRIFWAKYVLENDRYMMLLNFTVSHTLLDGEELSSALNLVRKYSSNFKDIL